MRPDIVPKRRPAPTEGSSQANNVGLRRAVISGGDVVFRASAGRLAGDGWQLVRPTGPTPDEWRSPRLFAAADPVLAAS
jgi:hypothetical protein